MRKQKCGRLKSFHFKTKPRGIFNVRFGKRNGINYAGEKDDSHLEHTKNNSCSFLEMCSSMQGINMNNSQYSDSYCIAPNKTISQLTEM